MANTGLYTKGERITRSLANPLAGDIAASEWLLLHTIGDNPDISSVNVGDALFKAWQRAHGQKPGFYLTWHPGYDVEKVLIRYEEIGLLKISGWENGKPCWRLTARGRQVLDKWKNRVSDILGLIAEDS